MSGFAVTCKEAVPPHSTRTHTLVLQRDGLSVL